jgi:predicted lipoprotein
MKHSTIKKLGSVLAIFAIIAACSKNKTATPEPTGNQFNRQEMLANYADNIVVPAYTAFKVELEQMVAKSDAFNANPTKASLTEFRQAWVNAYINWQKVELFEFGAADKYVLRSYFNVYPANVSSISSNVASGSANFELPSTYTSQGFPAIDYLINGLGSTDEEIVAFYTTAPDAAKRAAYLKKITTQMTTVLNQVYAEWKGSQRESFINKTGMDASSSTSTMVNGFVRNYERSLRSGKFGIPAGTMLNGTVSPEKVEAFYKKNISVTLAKTAHRAAVDFFNGKNSAGAEGPSIKTYLNALSASDQSKNSLTKAIADQFIQVDQKINSLPSEDLSSVVRSNNQLMVDVFTELQKNVRLLKVDMTSALSITITYTDNDGD